MAKEKKTTTELAAWVAEEIGISAACVMVRTDPAIGWHATVIGALGQTNELQRRADLAASELRTLYDLQD
jgi:hypothetical protein